jgi:anti-sigma B factor antagonist
MATHFSVDQEATVQAVTITKTGETEMPPALRWRAAPSLTPQPRPGRAVNLRISGEIDGYTAPALWRELDAQIDRKPQVMVLDLNGVTFLGAAGIQLLVDVRDRAMRVGTVLRLLCTSRSVVRPLTMFNLITFDPETGLGTMTT